MHEHHRDRLREKLLIEPETVNDYEILEVILFNAIPRKNTNDIAHRLIDRFGSVIDVFKASPHELMEVEGVGKNTAVYLSTLGLVLGRKTEDEIFPKVFEFNRIRQPLIEAFSGYNDEVFMAFFLDKKQNILSKRIIHGESKYKVDLDLKQFSRQIVLIKPTYVAIAHNHLSEHCQPSASDDDATEKICLLCALNGVTLIDHIIIAGTKAYSYYYDQRLDVIRKRVELKLS